MEKKTQLTNTKNLEGGCTDNEYLDFTKSFTDKLTQMILTRKQLFPMKSVIGDVTDVFQLFKVEVDDLWEVFINNIDEEYRQYHNCNCCKTFIRRYGNLVFINENGTLSSPLWYSDNVPDVLKKSIKALNDIVTNGKVNDIFITKTKVLGEPEAGGFPHMHLTLPNMMVCSNLTDEQLSKLSAQGREDVKMITGALGMYSVETIKNALKLLKTDSLNRSEKFVSNVEWLLELKNRVDGTKNQKYKNNIIWKCTASAPVGFCHIGSSVIGTLLDDIDNDLDYDLIKSRFNEKVDLINYQRPVAAPSNGNINRAEKIIKELGLEKSLERRFARADEIQKIWEPVEDKKEEVVETGIFSHLRQKSDSEKKDIKIPRQTMSWDKFKRTVLPDAKRIECEIPTYSNIFIALVTAEHEDAPPIIKYDTPENRNPFSTYMYSVRSACTDWNVRPGFNEVTCITDIPSNWYPGFEHISNGAILVIKDLKDTRYKYCGNALFPEILIQPLHEVRSTIEAYSRKAVLHGYEESSACGIYVSKNGLPENITIRVHSELGTVDYSIDRWD